VHCTLSWDSDPGHPGRSLPGGSGVGSITLHGLSRDGFGRATHLKEKIAFHGDPSDSQTRPGKPPLEYEGAGQSSCSHIRDQLDWASPTSRRTSTGVLPCS
jgi:hypothetical protein